MTMMINTNGVVLRRIRQLGRRNVGVWRAPLQLRIAQAARLKRSEESHQEGPEQEAEHAAIEQSGKCNQVGQLEEG